jgi:hypothetical protein
MKRDMTDGKDTKATNHPETTVANESCKRPWQTPEVIEEDYRETEAGFDDVGSDNGIYS